jgi:hypothetical protein
MSYRCCRPKDPDEVFGECLKSDLNRLEPLNLYGDVGIFCLISVIDALIIVYYRRKAKFDPYALAFIFLLWLAFLASMLGSVIFIING